MLLFVTLAPYWTELQETVLILILGVHILSSPFILVYVKTEQDGIPCRVINLTKRKTVTDSSKCLKKQRGRLRGTNSEYELRRES